MAGFTVDERDLHAVAVPVSAHPQSRWRSLEPRRTFGHWPYGSRQMLEWMRLVAAQHQRPVSAARAAGRGAPVRARRGASAGPRGCTTAARAEAEASACPLIVTNMRWPHRRPGHVRRRHLDRLTSLRTSSRQEYRLLTGMFRDTPFRLVAWQHPRRTTLIGLGRYSEFLG